MAAGAARRFGGGKLTAPWSGGRLIHGALAAALAAPVRTVTVVTGADTEVGPAATHYAEVCGQLGRLRLIHASDHDQGMTASLKTGVLSLPADCAGVFVFLGDMPLIPQDISHRLADALAAGVLAAAPVCGGRRGHPVLFSRSVFVNICQLHGDTGAGGVLRDMDARLVLVETPDPGVLFDVDAPSDLTRHFDPQFPSTPED